QTRSVGRALPDVEPAPSERDRLDELAHIAPVGEVLFRLHSAARAKRRRQVGCDRPVVEGVRAALGDGAQRAGERRLDEPVAFPRRLAARHEEPVAGAAQLVFLHRPIPRQAWVHWKPLLRIADGGLKQFVETLGPVGGETLSGGTGPSPLIASSETAAPDRPEPLTATTLPPPAGA